MKLRKVDPKRIRVPEVRVTARMSEETNEQFKSSVREVGIDEPIKCYEVDGELVLSDGLHRLMEAIRLNLPVVEVYVREGTMADVLCNNLMSGHLRGTHPVSEMVKSITVLWTEYQMDSEEIAKRTGLIRAYVEDLQLISQLTPLIRAELDEGWMGIGRARELTRLKDPLLQETVFGQLQLYRWKVPELRQYITDVLGIRDQQVAAPPTAGPKEPIKIACFYCKTSCEVAEVAYPPTCRECAAVLIGAIAAARQEVEAEQAAKAEEGKTPVG